MLKGFSIGKKTMIGGLALACIPICIVGLFSIRAVSNDLFEVSGKHVQVMSEKLADLCDLVLKEQLKTAEILGSENKTFVECIESKSLEQKRNELGKMLFRKAKVLGDNYEAVAVTDLSGMEIASDKGARAGNLSVGDREYFKKAVRGEANIGEMVISKSSGEPVLPIAAPVSDHSGKIHGVVLLVLNVDFLIDKVSQTKIGDSGFGVLLNEQGLTLAHPKPEYIMKLDISRSKDGEMDPVWHLVKNHTSGIAQFSLNGVKKLAGVTPLSVKPWSIAVNQSVAELLLPAHRIRNAIAAVGGVFLLITIILVTFFARHLARPMVDLAKRAGRLSLGNLDLNEGDHEQDEKLKGRKDEIGEISRAFGALEDYMKEKADVSVLIAEGDLKSNVKVASDEDVLGVSFVRMIGNLKEVVSQVDKAALQIDSGTTQVSDSSQSLSSGATEQAASLEEITSSVTQLASQTKLNAENAAQANRLSEIAREKAEGGNRQIGEMTTAMSGISASSKEIAKIIKTIDDIAFQTNLLALNAAVEAARAGKHGKGFAVVAQEVRSLAGRSAKAAQETAVMIEGALKTIDNGSDIVERTAQSLIEIVDGATQASELVAEIARASNEQADGISQINQGLSQVEQVTQQNTANAEQTASAVDELSNQASNLRQLVSFFKLSDREYEAANQSKEAQKTRTHQLEHMTSNHDSGLPGKPDRPDGLLARDIISFDDDGEY